jgi:hypothetical protein
MLCAVVDVHMTLLPLVPRKITAGCNSHGLQQHGAGHPELAGTYTHPAASGDAYCVVHDSAVASVSYDHCRLQLPWATAAWCWTRWSVMDT